MKSHETDGGRDEENHGQGRDGQGMDTTQIVRSPATNRILRPLCTVRGRNLRIPAHFAAANRIPQPCSSGSWQGNLHIERWPQSSGLRHTVERLTREIHLPTQPSIWGLCHILSGKVRRNLPAFPVHHHHRPPVEFQPGR